MATNTYFSPKVKTEQFLYEDIVIEALKFYGQDVLYIPRQLLNYDNVLNEDYSEFTDSYNIEMYIENTEGFGGEGDLMSKFGLEIRDQATFIVSKRRWEQLVGVWNNSINNLRPSEGDLIFLPLSNSLFQIKLTEHEQPFYQLNNLPVYKLQCELFEYSNEEFETGIEEIDRIERNFASTIAFAINEGSGIFIPGETIRQDTGETDLQGNQIFVEGEVSRFEPIDSSSVGYIHINDYRGTDGEMRYFSISNIYPIVGQTSGAEWKIFQSKELDSDFAQITDPAATNTELEQAADGIIDFSEANPFGEPDVDVSSPFGNGITIDSIMITVDTTSITADVGEAA